MLHYEEWGEGDPVIALHPLALESSAFAGVAPALASHGLRTLAVDLPGFGRSPAPDAPLTPECLAAPVTSLARSLERPPLLVGMSLGGRIALEVALQDPSAVRGVVLVAPFMPFRSWWRGALELMRYVDPSWAEWLALEHAWPVLQRLAQAIENRPNLEHDWLARAAARCVYYSSCPATRVAFLSATRGMALDPADGPEGVWERLVHVGVPTTFLWAGRDGMIPRSHMDDVDAVLPDADQLEVPCAAHFVSGAHFACMRHAISLAVQRTLETERSGGIGEGMRTLTPCLAGVEDFQQPAGPSASEPVATARGASR